MKNIYLDTIYAVSRLTNYHNLYSVCKRKYETDDSYYENELHILAEIVNNNTVTLLEIATIFYKTKSYISQVVSGLEAKGLVVKMRSEDDARKTVYKVTDKGMQVHLAHEHYDLGQSERLAQFFSGYSADDMRLFNNMLERYHGFQLADPNAITQQKKRHGRG